MDTTKRKIEGEGDQPERGSDVPRPPLPTRISQAWLLLSADENSLARDAPTEGATGGYTSGSVRQHASPPRS